MAKGICRSASRNVRLPRGSLILGSSMILHCLSSILGVGGFMDWWIGGSVSSGVLEGFVNGLGMLPLQHLTFGQEGEWQKFLTARRPFICREQKMHHVH